MTSLNEKFGDLELSFLTGEDLITLVENLNVFYNKCMSGIMSRNDGQYWDNYNAMKETYGVLTYLSERYQTPKAVDSEGIEKLLATLQVSKCNWDKLESGK